MSSKLLFTIAGLFIILFSSCEKDIFQGKPTAAFEPDVSVGEDMLSVKFTNTSKDAVSYVWDFDDGSATVSETHTEHLFQNSGSNTRKYQVSLVAESESGETDTAYCIITVCKKPTALFTVISESGESPFAVKFTSQSINASSYRWDYGDTFTANDVASPTHTFFNNRTQAVVYTVTLTVKNEFGSTAAYQKSITVNPPAGINHLAMGNPSNAQFNIVYADNYLMTLSQYTISYNNSKLTANWVSWHLSSEWLGGVDRQDDFRENPAIPSTWYAVQESEYSGSGFDRGHMCPSADRTLTIPDNSSTFLMTNMIPQSPDNNQETWADLESYCRSLVYAGNELYVISGPYGQGGTGSKGYRTTVGNGVVVPSDTWKIIVVLPMGTNDALRVTETTRVIAVKMPNNMSCSAHPWTYYRTSVDYIETLTGFDFLSNISVQIQSVIEARIDSEKSVAGLSL